MMGTSMVRISQADYKELLSDDSRWTLEEYAYWAAKFCSGYPAEGYGLYSPHVGEDNYGYYIAWNHSDSCD